MASSVSGTSKMVGDAALAAATGRSEAEWFAILDAAGANTWTHTEIARWVFDNHDGIDGWWSQGVTVRYEQARGLRLPGQMADGTFAASVSKSFVLDQPEALDAAIAVLAGELGEHPASINRTAKFFTARWKLDTGEAMLAQVNPTAKGKTGVVLTRSKITDPTAVETAKKELSALLAKLAESVASGGSERVD